ncbi:MAG: hypothetical protein ACFE8A_10380 [Candidatus Hodarchaeota archaeon]
MKQLRYAKLSIQAFILIIASMLAYVAFIGGYSALLILEDEDNIDLEANFVGDIMVNPSLFEIEIDFTIDNKGYSDLEDITIEIELLMVYQRDTNNDGIGEPVEVTIFDDDESFDAIKAGKEETRSFKIKYEDITNVNWNDILLNAEPAYDILFTAETIVISATYSYSLLSFKVELEDTDLGTYFF